MPFIAPWLETRPSDFTSAAEAGSRAGLADRSESDDIGLRRAQLAQQAAEAGQRAGLEARGQDMEQQRAKVEGEIAKQKASLEYQTAARKFAAQQKYQQTFQKLEDSGISPSDAAMQATLTAGPMDLGESSSGIASMMKATAPPGVMDLGGGARGVFQPGLPMRIISNSDVPKNAPLKLSDVDRLRASQLQRDLSSIDAHTVKLAGEPDPATARVLRMQREQKQKELESILGRYDPANSQPSTPQPKATMPQDFIGARGGQNRFDPTATGFTNGAPAPAAQPAQAPANAPVSSPQDPLGLF